MGLEYRITQRGRKELETGNYLMHLANEAAEGGTVSSKELVQLDLGLIETEADYVISILSGLGFIEPVPIQGVKYTTTSQGRSDAQRN